MSPLSKAGSGKAKGLAIIMAPKDDESESGMSESDYLSEIAAAVNEKDGDGAAQAIAAYVESCMAKKE